MIVFYYCHMKVNIYEFLQNGYLSHLLPFFYKLKSSHFCCYFLLWLKFYGNLMFGFSVVLNFVYKGFDQILVGMCQFSWSYGKYYRIFDENARRGRVGCWKIGLILVESLRSKVSNSAENSEVISRNSRMGFFWYKPYDKFHVIFLTYCKFILASWM